MGTSEIYRTVLALHELTDALVVDIEGWMPLFVVLRDSAELDDPLARILARITEPFYDQIVDLSDDGGLDKNLRELAALLLTAVMQPQNLQLRRLVIGEAGRFPELGRAYEQEGPQRAINALTTAFQRLAAKGQLRLEDPALAAAQFNYLVVSIPLNHAMFSGDDQPPGRAALKRYTNGAVRVFLAAYPAT
jgi:hypothetical protein